MLKVGITGGIGSGKSVICKVFNQLKVPVFNADQIAKELIKTDDQIISSIKKHFSSSIYTGDNILDVKKLAEIVFNNPESLEKLNSIVHPAVKSGFINWLKDHEHLPYVLKEAAILFESKTHLDLDAIIVVTAPQELRIRRVIKRDKVSREAVVQRMKNQMSDKEKIARTDYTIINDGSSLVLPQILKIHEDLISRADS